METEEKNKQIQESNTKREQEEPTDAGNNNNVKERTISVTPQPPATSNGGEQGQYQESRRK